MSSAALARTAPAASPAPGASTAPATTPAASPAPATTPAASPAPPAADAAPVIAAPAGPAPVRATLSNGMRVVLLPDALAPVVTTIVEYGVGSADDTMPGIAHATEHMLFRGTRTVSAGQFADLAARMGAQYNAQTSETTTIYFFKIPSSYLDLVLHLEADRMANATIAASAWATERGAIEQEIRARDGIPTYRVGLKVRETFFRGTPFADATGGTVPSFEKMTADEIRAFYRTWYQPGNATLYVAGNFEPARALARIRALFEPLPSRPVPQRAPLVIPPLPASTVQGTIDFPIGIGGLAYRFPGATASDAAAANVLEQVFASGESTFGDLRASGKVAAVLTFSSAFPEVGASFFLALPGPGSTPQASQDALRAVLDGYRKDGVPAHLIDEAKLQLTSQQSYAESSIMGLASAWAQGQVLRRTPDEIFEAIAQVTPDGVNRVLRTYLTPDHEIAIVLTAKPSSTAENVDPSAAVENVGYTPAMHEPLPAWAREALKAPLRVPEEGRTTVIGTLPNGLRYAIRRETASPTVVVAGAVRTSPELYEPKGKEGVAGILDPLMAWGTTTYDRKAYQAQFDAIAATGAIGTSFGLRLRAGDFDRGMALLADGELHPAFPDAGFTVAKAALLQGLTLAEKVPAQRAAAAKRDALYPPRDPRRRHATAGSVQSIALNDVKRYYRTTFRPDEAKIVIVGDVVPAHAIDVLRATFGGWKAEGAPPSFRFPPIPSRAAKAETVRVRSATNVLSEVSLDEVVRMKRGDPDYVPLLLATVILSGEGTGSLLFQELRTRRGYVYTAESAFDLDQRGGDFRIAYASEPKNVDRANAAIVAIIKRLQDHPLPVADVQHAKALLLAQRVLPLDSYTGLAAELLAGATDGFDEARERAFWSELLATTPAQLQHALHRIDATRFLRVIVEPGSAAGS